MNCRHPGRRLGTVWLVLFSLLASTDAQDEGERQLDLAGVRQSRQSIVDASGLDETTRNQIVELYDQAIGDLETARASGVQTGAHRFDRSRVEARIAALRAQLARLQQSGEVPLPDTEVARTVEDRLTRERALLSSLRVGLRDLQSLAEERLRRRGDIGRDLGSLDQQVEALNSEVRATADLAASAEYKDAARVMLLASRQALLAHSEALRAELELLESRARLLPWRRDLAEIQVARQEEFLHRLEDRVRELRAKSAREALIDVRTRVATVAEGFDDEEADQFLNEMLRLAEVLWAPDGIIARTLRTEEALAEARGHIATLESIAQLTRRRYEAVGNQGDITQWFTAQPTDFPRIPDIRNDIQQWEALIPDVQHGLIQYEQERARFLEVQRDTEAFLDDQAEQVTPELVAEVRALVHSRQEILDRLISYSARYSGRLVELVAVSENLLQIGEALRSFISERILWVRSVPDTLIPSLETSFEALGWLVSPVNWGPVITELWAAALARPLRLALSFIAMVGLLRYRGRILRRLELLGERVEGASDPRFLWSFEALLHTVLLAAPVPLLLFATGRFLSQSEYSFASDAGGAVVVISQINALFELSRQWLRPRGFGEAHLGWSARLIGPIRTGLFWPQVFFLPPLYVALHLGWAGIMMDAPAQLQAFNNSLGRMAFIFGAAGLGLTLSGVFRPTGTRSSRRVWLYALQAITLSLTVPALLALAGYYVTGMLLAYQALRTLWLVAGLVILGTVVARWFDTRSPAQVLAPDAEASSELRIALERQSQELEVAETRTRELAHFVQVLILFAGLFAIWAPALPALEFLKRVQVWPDITLMQATAEEQAQRAVILGAPAAEAAPGSEVESNVDVPGQLQQVAGASVSEAAGTLSVVTLWNLLQALLAGLITAGLVRNVPGVVELVLMKRTFVDGGARIAISTLARYAIMILGIVITFRFLGITWAKTQWLAAALTFGLGFGLQEIVANFISGLILLLERPIRVGDAVRIGELQGRVTRTQIRATTIALFDRSELIVPNKDFITKTLVNWTLSDSKRRIEIPIRLAYGSDLKRVKALLKQIAAANPAVLEDPPPNPLLIDFADDAIKMELRVFVDFGQGLEAKDQLLLAVDEAFKKEGIEFALPRMTIQVPEPVSQPEAAPRSEETSQ